MGTTATFATRRVRALSDGATGTVQGEVTAAGTFAVEWDAPVTDAPDSAMTDERLDEQGATWAFTS